jgi:hypothetical protein
MVASQRMSLEFFWVGTFSMVRLLQNDRNEMSLAHDLLCEDHRPRYIMSSLDANNSDILLLLYD